jgi:hypothetical protein
MIRANKLPGSGLFVFKGLFCSFRSVRAVSGQILWDGSPEVSSFASLALFAVNSSPFQAMKSAFSPRVMYPLKSTNLLGTEE